MDLYCMDVSPPCRAVMLTGKALGIHFNTKLINIFEKDQMKPEFMAINPLHCIPTLVDGDLIIWESRAICTYLVSAYGKDDFLYPSDPKRRVLVDRLLYFDIGRLMVQFGEYINPVLVYGAKEPKYNRLERLKESLIWLEDVMRNNKFATGDNITVADHSLVASISTFKEAGIDLSEYKNINRWLERCEADMPDYATANFKGAKEFGNLVKEKLSGENSL